MSASATVLPEKATHQQTRAFNQQLVLRALHDRSPLSRADLARITGLTRTSVGDLVGTLMHDGLVEEVGRGQSSGGKSPILLGVAPHGRHLIGLDLGEAAVQRCRREPAWRDPALGRTCPSRAGTAMPRSSSSASSSTPCAPMTALRFLGIGIGAPGRHRHELGDRPLVGQPRLGRPPLGPLLEERYGMPVVVANDSHAAALAELTFYRRPRPTNLVVIRVGRGIGAGIILNGQLFQGDGHGAGEFGHISVAGADRSVPLRPGRLPRDAWRACARWSTRPARCSPSITDEDSLVRRLPVRRGRHPADRPRCRARARHRDRLADRPAQRPPRPAGRPRRRVRRRLAGRGPASRRGRAPWPCSRATRRSTTATSTTTSSRWARPRC